MAIDRFGRYVMVGWSVTEEAWLDAIIEMGCQKKHIQELSELTGRPIHTIRYHISKKRANAASERRRAYKRQYLAKLAHAESLVM